MVSRFARAEEQRFGGAAEAGAWLVEPLSHAVSVQQHRRLVSFDATGVASAPQVVAESILKPVTSIIFPLLQMVTLT